MVMIGSDETNSIFVTPKTLSKETGFPYQQILNDIKSGKLPAIRRGKSYYIYNQDSSKYIFDIVCKARGLDPNKYSSLIGIDEVTLIEGLRKKVNNDKSKD